MATYQKYDIFVENLSSATMTLFGTAGAGADTCKVALTNQTPDLMNDAVLGDIGEISAGFGYTAGGDSVQNVGTRSTGTFTLTGTNVTWTASGGDIGPFQYVVLYDDTPSSPAKPLIGMWDLGFAITLNDTATLTIKFNGGASSGTAFTLA